MGFPWSQQSAGKQDTAGSASSESVENTTGMDGSESGKVPWQQQSATQKSASSTEPDITEIETRQVVRRVVIDPETGLYIDPDSQMNTSQASKNMNFEDRQENLIEWGYWKQEGRIGLSVGKDAYNGSLNWEQEGDTLDFRFRGPLGIGGVRIHGTLGEEVRVKTTRGEEFLLQDVEVEMQEQLGWSLPINSLRYWVLGITDPELDAELILNENDLLDELEQGDWKVVYDSYMDIGKVTMPKKLKVSGPDTKITLLVNSWTIPKED
jgi:outer membrane lipoprotein LolB